MRKISVIPSPRQADQEEYFNSVLDLVRDHYKRYPDDLPSLTRQIHVTLANLYILYDRHTDPRVEDYKELRDEVQKMIVRVNKARGEISDAVVNATVGLLRENWGFLAKERNRKKGNPSTYYRKTVLPFCIPYIEKIQKEGITLAYLFDLFEKANRNEFQSDKDPFGNFSKAVQAARKRRLTPQQREVYRSAFNRATGAKL